MYEGSEEEALSLYRIRHTLMPPFGPLKLLIFGFIWYEVGVGMGVFLSF